VGEVMQRIDSAGLAIESVDVTILGARPRLGGARLDAMATVIGGLLGIAPTGVSVKAATANLGGDEGAGRAISASCLVSMVSR
jgi:2C-methyl-D-erythritol 2,4-cyclodiphosphate synthase